MTDQNEELPQPTDEQKADRDQWVINENRRRDLDLDALLDVVFGFDDEKDSNNVRLTLITSGSVVSGRAVARSAWLEQLNADTGHEYVKDVLALIEADTSKAKKEHEEQLKAEGRPSTLRRYVYLLEAQVFGNGGVYKLPATKIDLSHVGAWSVGSPS